MIDTKTYQLTKKQYRSIVFNTLRKNVLKLIPFVLIWSFLLGWYVGYFLVLYIGFALFVISFILLFWFSIKNLKPFFSETHMQFDEEFIYITKNNGASQWHFLRLKKVVSEENYWLIYMTNTQYIYVPKDIFLTEEDQLKFKRYLRI